MSIEAAHQAYNEERYDEAFALYSELADSNPQAKSALAFLYQHGIGTQSDEAKATELFEQAATAHEPTALYNLAILYANGLGGKEVDQFKAHELYLDAATRELPEAMFESALMLERGLGCTQNYSEAAFWYEEGAKRAHVKCFNNLGVLYKDGLGVEQNYERAFLCFFKASEYNLPEAQYNVGLMFDQGQGCKQDHEKALEYCRKAAHNGHDKAKQLIKSLQEDGTIAF